jgi:hypothetical protein
MIDMFSLLLTHGLIGLAAWRLLARADLDDDKAAPDADPRKASWARLRGGTEPPGA